MRKPAARFSRRLNGVAKRVSKLEGNQDPAMVRLRVDLDGFRWVLTPRRRCLDISAKVARSASPCDVAVNRVHFAGSLYDFVAMSPHSFWAYSPLQECSLSR